MLLLVTKQSRETTRVLHLTRFMCLLSMRLTHVVVLLGCCYDIVVLFALVYYYCCSFVFINVMLWLCGVARIYIFFFWCELIFLLLCLLWAASIVEPMAFLVACHFC